jgi:hypothetical protein
VSAPGQAEERGEEQQYLVVGEPARGSHQIHVDVLRLFLRQILVMQTSTQPSYFILLCNIINNYTE